MGTINVMVGEILVDGKVSKRTMVEIKNDQKLVNIAHEQAKSLDKQEKEKYIEDYQEGKFEYCEDESLAVSGHSALAVLKMKNIVLTNKQRSNLIGSLSLDEKMYFGNWLNDNESTANTIRESVDGELDDELKFGKKTFQDGVEVFTNNKY